MSNDHLYGLASDKSAVSVWNGTYGGGPADWTVIGNAASEIVARG